MRARTHAPRLESGSGRRLPVPSTTTELPKRQGQTHRLFQPKVSFPAPSFLEEIQDAAGFPRLRPAGQERFRWSCGSIGLRHPLGRDPARTIDKLPAHTWRHES